MLFQPNNLRYFYPQPQNKVQKQPQKNEEEEYDPLKMPCDWDLAEKHAKSRRTAPDLPRNNGKQIEQCPCCGFEVDREEINFFDSPEKQLAFLGSGYALFYNFIVYCVVMLFLRILVVGFFNIITNYYGDYCSQTVTETTESGQSYQTTYCPDSIFLKLSLANKLDATEKLAIGTYLNFTCIMLTMLVLLYFRKSQKQIDSRIDSSQTTAKDFSICVKNIPTNLDEDYHEHLKNILENYAVTETHKLHEPIVVKKIVFVYDIEEILVKEKEINNMIEKKKKIIKKNNFRYHGEEIEKIDEQIEKIEHEIHLIEKECLEKNKNLTGIAYVSFETEHMKNILLAENQHNLRERLHTYLNGGKTPDYTHIDLTWNDQKLFLESAPEPNDIDWEFIHVKTHSKIWNRIKAYTMYFLFEFSVFYLIYWISLKLSIMSDEAIEALHEGVGSQKNLDKINLLSSNVGFLIVLFNKFGVAYSLHKIVDSEQHSTKTKFQISFARKYSVALFMNAAMISYIVDIVLLQNIRGQGGFIINESSIFVLNAFFPPLIWLIDPWSICKNLWRKGILQNKDRAVFTQEEANKWMEQPDYLNAKRYSDIMKTMWFTYLYASAIPLGTVVSMMGLICYYYIDKYNVLYRRTLKESISIDLTNEMIQMLELCLLFCPIGAMTMSYAFFKTFHGSDIILLIFSSIYFILPTDYLSLYLFPIKENIEKTRYDEVCKDFDTDYDRENPITKREAIKEFNQKHSEGKIKDQKHQNLHSQAHEISIKDHHNKPESQ